MNLPLCWLTGLGDRKCSRPGGPSGRHPDVVAQGCQQLEDKNQGSPPGGGDVGRA